MKKFNTLLGLTLTLVAINAKADLAYDLESENASLSEATQMIDSEGTIDFNSIEARPGWGPGQGPGRGPGYPPGGPGRGPGYPPPGGPGRGPGYPPGRGPGYRFTDITCESYSYRPAFCQVWGAERVELLQQYSQGRGQCIAGRTFYVTNNGLQVTDGCRGLFRVYVR